VIGAERTVGRVAQADEIWSESGDADMRGAGDEFQAIGEHVDGREVRERTPLAMSEYGGIEKEKEREFTDGHGVSEAAQDDIAKERGGKLTREEKIPRGTEANACRSD
jgi:hypothetical protein